MDVLNLPLVKLDPHSPAYTGIRGRCPRCGEGKLFCALLTLAPCVDGSPLARVFFEALRCLVGAAVCSTC